MIKRTLYFGNPAYLSKKNDQLVINLPGAKGIDNLTGNNTVPIEDIGVILLDHQQITITHGLMDSLLNNNVALIMCDKNHLPTGLMLPLEGNLVQSERFQDQIEASLPLKKQLWQQTITAKIANQANILANHRNVNIKNMEYWAAAVKSGDADNHEARAAAYYWGNLFPEIPDFRRERDGIAPNYLLNYGYAILRGIIARSLVSTGLLPTLGIHHHNRYNAYCLADDIMEPYRPVVDHIVVGLVKQNLHNGTLTQDVKIKLLSIPQADVLINGQRSPLFIAASQTTASLYKCFSGELRKIAYPEMVLN
ncbi:type II CRISPR-associated endonuclease Cas1 [Parabacteroides sp. FAFU027]|uniref:type II CRISPR-associated endonuclease Cas1 n=1 Tax=Parabacteroides sp. FAFU027 TaxID=2922715 RepID=UPI001FAEA961|nr:type II CRISPR-associated endonuclease Cas1 [Parabacteroides sp. FAFU027]